MRGVKEATVISSHIKMIETTEYKKIQDSILHRIRGEISIEDVGCGINEANEIINRFVLKYGRFNLIIDTRDYHFTDLAAHKAWKIWLNGLKGKVTYVSIIVVDSPHTRAEKEQLSTKTVQFFFNFDEGSNWLQKTAGIEKRA